MKCRQCSNPVKVKFGNGFCSSTCMDFKPRPKKRLRAIELDENVVFVDASDEEVIPLYPKQRSLSREELIKEFKELAK
jgi:hypothetical protein